MWRQWHEQGDHLRLLIQKLRRSETGLNLRPLPPPLHSVKYGSLKLNCVSCGFLSEVAAFQILPRPSVSSLDQLK